MNGKRRRMNFNGIHWITVITSLFLLIHYIYAMDPKFDPSTRMRLVLVPADAAIGSVIYRLRATDEEFDYPLTFELVGNASTSTVQIETLPCTKYNSVCQANVVLARRLESGRYYDFQVTVKDTKGGKSIQSCSITVTNFTTPHNKIFPHKPGIIMIPEDAKRGTELDYVTSRRNPLSQTPVYLELWGSPLFAIRQKIVKPEITEGTIFLLGPLDFEKQSMYHLTVLANDAYAEAGQDTRNIAGLEVFVIVQDVQDMPPIFTLAPPITQLSASLLPGDKILQVHAEDGDKGAPREIRYGLVSEGNPFTSFFDINETTGELFLLKPIDEISAITHVGYPVLLTVIAEEVKVARDEPVAMSTTAQIGFLLPEPSNSAPYFENDNYIARIEENSPQGTTLVFPDPYITTVSDDDPGKNGVFSLTLLNNNGTFEISPTVVERRANFLIRVRDNQMLDYEMYTSLQFQIVAQELGPATNLSAIANVTIYIDDVNDNPPVFEQSEYVAELPENMTAGTRIIQVQATDVDTGLGGKIRYTQILGYLNTSLNLDPGTGIITVSTDNHGFDREQMKEYHFYVEARDMNGNGNPAQVLLIVRLIDVNDETPTFEKSLYEFILSPELRNFTVPAFIRAIDRDAEAPNNVVQYELVQGNYENKFFLNKDTGELTVREPPLTLPNRNRRKRQASKDDDMQVFILMARAFDLGVPVRWSTTVIKVYPPESRMRTIMFILQGSNLDRHKTEQTLSDLTGGRVSILDIKPYTESESKSGDGGDKDKSMVTATVLYDGNSLVDITKIQEKISVSGSTSMGIEKREDSDVESVYKAENRIYFWLLIFLALLIALAILTLLFCCICSWCPLYGATRKRVIRVNSQEDDVHLVRREQEIGKQSKSVQVAEWMGRREAWSAEKSCSDPRTKPTRWEFSRRNINREKLGETTEDDSSGRGDIRLTSTEVKQHRMQQHKKTKKHIKEISTAKEIQLHNSRTNLINDREVYIEDMPDDRDYQSIRKKTDIDDDSIRRQDMDRDIQRYPAERKSSLKRTTTIQEEQQPREQVFIKEGNAEILRLVTRGKTDEDGLYVNLQQRTAQSTMPQPQYIMVDNMGKEILLRRYIEEQSNGKQIIREHYQVIPGVSQTQFYPNEPQTNVAGEMFSKSNANSIVYANQPSQDPNMVNQQMNAVESTSKAPPPQTNAIESDMQNANSHHSIVQQELEMSLKQQNQLLRQILLEKERLEEKTKQEIEENELETQSLPCHSMAVAATTQTDCEIGTQTDRIEKRRSRSENDDSMSEEEYEYVKYTPINSPDEVYYLKRKKTKKKTKHKEETPKRRVVVVESVKRKIRTPIQEERDEEMETTRPPARETKASLLRKLKNNSKDKSSGSKSPSLKKDTLLEISDSLDDRKSKPKEKRKYVRKIKTEEVYEESEGEQSSRSGSDDEIVRDSLDDRSEDENLDDELTYKIKKSRLKNVDFSGRGSSNDVRDYSPEREYYHKRRSSISSRESRKSSKPVNETKSGSASPAPSTRISRRDSTKETVIKTSTKRQAASEPPLNRVTKPTKPPDVKRKKSFSDGSKSEMDILKKLADEGVDVSKGVPRYMEWYFKDKSVKAKEPHPVAKPPRKSNLKKTSVTTSSTSLRPSECSETRRSEERLDRFKPEPLPRSTASPSKTPRLLREDIQLAKQYAQNQPDSNHPLLQHSEHRFEHKYQPGIGPEIPQPTSKLPHYLYPATPPQVNRESKSSVRINMPKPSPIHENEVKNSKSSRTTSTSRQLNASTLAGEHDSGGIAVNSLLYNMGRRNPIADKKSVFTIAYDDVKINRIRTESDSPNI